MIDLQLTRGNNREGVFLRFPATPAEIGSAFALLDTVCDDGELRVTELSSPIRNLRKYIKPEELNATSDLEKLNRLAERIDEMPRPERRTFEGAMDAESIHGLDDVLRVAEHIGDYIRMEEISSDRTLGDHIIAHGFLKDCPEKFRPYLDPVAIGIEYYDKCGGAYTLDGYVLRKESAIQFGLIEQNSPKETRTAVFELILRANHRQTALRLPADLEELEEARNVLGVEEFAQARIDCINCIPYAADVIPNCLINVEDANELALAIEEMRQTDGELLKYFSALAVEKPFTFQDALKIALDLDDYERVPEDLSEYGRMVLRRTGMDDEMLDTIDGYMDFALLGEYAMEEDGVVRTEFGLVRRCSAPFEGPSRGGMLMR